MKKIRIAIITFGALFLLLTSLTFPAFAQSGNASTTVNLELRATFHSISVYASFAGDDNENNNALLEYREAGGSWKPGGEMVVDRTATLWTGNPNPFYKQWRSSILLLSPDTEYEVKVTFTDPDDVEGSNPLVETISTRDENIPFGNGSVYFVAKNGSNDNDGSEEYPWLTIQKAADTIVAGDTVYVKAGIYTEQVDISDTRGTSDNWINFYNYGSGEVIIDAEWTRNYNLRVLNNSAYIVFHGFIFDRTSFQQVIINDSNDIVIENSILRESDSGGYRGRLHVENSNRCIIRHNTIDQSPTVSDTFGIQLVSSSEGGHIIYDNIIDGHTRNWYDGIGVSSAGSEYGGAYRDSDIYDNYISGAYDDIVELDGPNVNVRMWGNKLHGDPASGNGPRSFLSYAPVSIGPLYIFENLLYGITSDGYVGLKTGSTGAPSEGQVFFWNNTLAPNVLRGFSGYGGSNSHNQQYLNNIFNVSFKSISTSEDNAQGCEFDYNDHFSYDGQSQLIVWSGLGLPSSSFSTVVAFNAATGHEQHGIQADPSFNNIAAGDFTLQSNSPCVDTGVIIPGYNDATSPNPYQGSAPDIGAFEYNSGSPTNLPPVLAYIGNKSANKEELLQFTISATDPDGDNLTYSAFNLPSGANFNPSTRTFSWTPASGQAGNYTNVRFRVSDGSLTDSETITITVNETYEDWDVNTDGMVNVMDMIQVGQHWEEVGAPGWIREDVNKDGTVDVLDMSIIGQNWTG